MHPRQNTNQSLSQLVEVFNRGPLVASPFTGSVNDAVLLWANASTVTGPGAYATTVNSASAGTSVTLFKPGRYSVELGLASAASVPLSVAISQDVAAAGLNSTPTFAINGIVDVLRMVVPAAMNIPFKFTTELHVPRTAEQAGSIVRFHATLDAGDPPTNAIIQASAYFRIRNIGAAFI